MYCMQDEGSHLQCIVSEATLELEKPRKSIEILVNKADNYIPSL